MTGEHDGVGRQGGEALQALVHQLGIAPGQVGATAAVEEQRVAGDEQTVHEDALAARRVTRCVQQLDLDAADGHRVAGVVRGQLALGDAAHLADPR